MRHRLAAAKELLPNGLTSGALKPLISRPSLRSDREAHRYLESNQQMGKIVVTL